MRALYWVLVALAAYSYVIYPLLLAVLPRRKDKSRREAEPIRRVSVIIAARNEENKIERKIVNTLSLDHPGVDLEVLVASDASDDRTDEIVRGFHSKGVLLARSPQRNGKEYAQGLAIAMSTGEIIVFTDAGTSIPPESVGSIVRAFSDPQVGALSSVDRIVEDDGRIQGEGLYVRYEMWLRDLEANFNTLVGLSGSFFVARRGICEDWDIRVPSDFGTALNCARFGYRAISDRAVVGIYKNLSDSSREYHRKLRTTLRGMVGLRHRGEVLNPLRFGWFTFQVISHKLMRWAVPWLLLAAYAVNLTLLGAATIYVITAIATTFLFVTPLVVRLIPAAKRITPIRFAGFFVESNAAIFHATLLLLSGKSMMTWEPSKR